MGVTRSEWRNCIKFVLEREGGYVHHKDDPGGETNWGISKRAHPAVDIKSLTRNQAEAIYKSGYWIPCYCDQLTYPASLAVFDYAVNSGGKVARKALQRAVGATPDGKVGPKTMGALKRSSSRAIAKHVTDQRLSNFIRICKRRPASLVFLKGWMRRLIHLTEAFSS